MSRHTLIGDDFLLIVQDTLGHEKGYIHDPADPGGETNFGISKRSYPHLDIKNLTREQAIEIYYRDFWLKPKISQLEDFALARRLFDLGVNCGPATAIKMLQRAVNTVCAGTVSPERRAAWRQTIVRLLHGKTLRVDGQIGPITLGVIKACPYPVAMKTALRGEAYIHYKKGNPLYIPGWLLRLSA